MRYRTLGRTGIKVSAYALGALALGTPIGNPDHDDSTRIVHKALDAGINFVDTADAYGESEVAVGKALKGRRDNVVLATKFSRPTGEDPNQQGASRRWIMTAVENSLRRLQTDYIDLYQVHRPDPGTDVEETLSALSDLIRAGKVRVIGASNTLASDIIEAQWAAERRGLQRFRTEQPPYSILSRGIEREVLPVAQRYGMGILVWGPLGQGMLTGRVRKGQQSDLRRAHRVAAQVESGMTWINSHNVRDLRTPFGGVKASGLGREGGPHSLDFYTESRIVHVPLGDTHVPRFGA